MIVYLDNAASTPPKTEVLEVFDEVAKCLYGNPSSIHMAGVEANNVINKSKQIISKSINCKEDEIFFTTGATMSNNLFIQGMLRKHPEMMFITSTVEHNDIMLLYDWLPYSKSLCGVEKNGKINLIELEGLMNNCTQNHKPFFVSIQMANSETGIIQPIKDITNMIHDYGGFLHVDATQYIPYYPVDMEQMNIDALSMSGQKIGGLKGSGIFVARQTIQNHISPIIFGEQGLIGGTPSTPLIASLATAFELIDYDISDMANKRDWLLCAIYDMGGILVGTEDNRLPNNIYCRFPGIGGMNLVHLLNEQGIYAGTGSACSADSDRPSHVVLAYGLNDKEALECVRFTLSNDTTVEELQYVIKVLRVIISLLN